MVVRRDGRVMTMYLSNNEVGPTGYEGAEFIDVPVVADEVPPP